MDKTEWPTEFKLRRLREGGKVPLSPFACRTAGTIAFLMTLWLCRSRAVDAAKAMTALYESQLWDTTSHAETAIESLAVLFVAPLTSAFIVAMGVGLLQTRFLFRLDLLSPRFNRLANFLIPSANGLFMRLFRSLGQAMLFVLAGALMLRVSWTGMLYLLNHDRVYVLKWSLGVLPMVLAPVCTVLAIAAVLAWFVNRYWFLYGHRMTWREAQDDVVDREVHL